MNAQSPIGRIRYSLAGDKACPACAGTGHHEGVPAKYFDDDMRCWLPDYCEECSGTGHIAITCTVCEGAVDVEGYCRSCDQHTPVQGFRPIWAADDLPANSLEAQ